MTNESATVRRLLLIHWDGADWALIRPALQAGAMPTLARLLDESATGTFAPVEASPPQQSPRRWATLATGADDGAAPTLWDHLAASGDRTQIVGWPYGAPDRGVFVAPSFAGDPSDADAVRPEALAESIAPFRIEATELTAAHLLPFVPFLEGRDPADLGFEERQPVNTIARLLAECASLHAAITWLLEHDDADALVAHYDAFDRFGKQFRRFHATSTARAPESLRERYGEVMSGVVRFHDMMLERLLALAAPDDLVVLVGLPGATSGSDARGFVLFHGAPLQRDHTLSEIAFADVTPTILAALGTPIPRACTGAVRAEAFVTAPALTYVETDADAPTPPPTSPGAIAARFDEARKALRTSRPDEARPLLEELYDETAEPAHGMLLMSCYLRLKRPADARRTFERLLDVRTERFEREGISTDASLPAPLKLLQAKLQRAEKSYSEAYASLRRAEADAPQTALFYRRLGAVYLQLHQWPDAERAFRRALDIAPRFVPAHRWLAVALIRQGRYEEAEATASRAIALRPHFPALHYHRAIALMRLGRFEKAAEAAETSVAQQPAFSRARYLLTQLYRDHLDQPAKAMEHLMADPDAAFPPPSS
jgi:Flp pilus assembly protein TadD